MREILFLIFLILSFGQILFAQASEIEKYKIIGLKNDTSPIVKHEINIDSIEIANNRSVKASGSKVTKAYISRKDSSIYLRADIHLDHRIFGYAKPDSKSERLILFSIFTNDVEKNPFGCKLGSYYDTGGIQNIKLKYIVTVGNFIKAVAIDSSNNFTILYFEKKWVEFE
jgi:hypothetical protein